MVTTANKKPVSIDKDQKPVVKTAVVPAKKIATAAKLASATEVAPKASAVKITPKTVTKKAVVAKAKPVTKVAMKAKVATKSFDKLAAKTAVTKAVAKPATKVALAKSVGAKAIAAKPAVVPVHKAKKEKLVRDSFTMPESEYVVLSHVKKACLSAGIEVKKSQLLRIGLVLLNKTDVTSLKTLIAGLAPLKAGRPKKEK